MGLTKNVKLLAVALSCLGLMACANQKGFEGIKDIPTTVKETGEVEVDLTEVIEEANVAAQSVDSAEDEIADISNISFGGIWDILKIGKIKDKMLEGFDKVAEKLQGVRDRLTNLRVSLELKRDQLDEDNPLHQRAILNIERMIAKIDKLESKMDSSIAKLRDKVEKLFDKVDSLLANISVGGWIGDIISIGLRWTLEDLKTDVLYRFDELLTDLNV